MSDEVKMLLAALHYAVWNRRGISIAGSDFTAEQVEKIVNELEGAYENV